MTRRQIIAAFAEVKRIYFPRWDRQGRWTVEFGAIQQLRGSSGYCDSKAAKVFLADDVCGMMDAAILALLIHEICHDVGAAGHGRGWARRMEIAAKQAEKVDSNNVAFFLRNDIFCYCTWIDYQAITGLSAPPPIPRVN